MSVNAWLELREALQEAAKTRGALVVIAKHAGIEYKRVHELMVTGSEPSYSRGKALHHGLLKWLAEKESVG